MHLGADRPVLVRGEGCYVWDRAGRRYLDGTSGAFCAHLGYTRPDLLEAMSAAAARLPHARPSAFDSEEAEGYRAELLAAAGAPFGRVLLASSGSEAVEAAMKIAIAYQRARGEAHRTTIRSLAGHYHGATFEALRVTGWEERRAPWADVVGPRADGVPSRGDGSAALIAETIPAAGLGVLVPEPGELAARRAACDAAGALWIADEVLTGFGRCGALFAWQRLAARRDAAGARPDDAAIPDLVVFGKGAGAGLAALAGVLVSSSVAAALESSPRSLPSHHQTYGGNPIACAVGRAVLRARKGEDLDAKTVAQEEAMARALGRAAVGSAVRGIGALWALAPEDGQAGALHRGMRERGLLAHLATGDAASGAGPAVVLAPPLTMSDDDAATMVATIGSAVAGMGSVRGEAGAAPPRQSGRATPSPGR